MPLSANYSPPQPLVTVLGLLIASALPAESEPPEKPLELAPYIVTGSHLPVEAETVPVPLTTVDAETLQLWGDLSPISALRDQPFSFGAANTENESNGGTGSAGVNLRGLGNLSTLTLINGRRAGGNSAFGFQHGGFADLNLIPSAAIREIQVATDGTSVTYGSDAVAGTVNILLHDTFTGNRVDSSYSDTTDGDASEKAFSFLTGQNLSDKTHFILLGSWYQRNAIYARDRTISKNTDFTSQGGQNQGSLSFPGRIKVDDTEYVLIDPSAAPGDLSDYRILDDSVDRYNFNEAAPSIPSVERYSAMANLSHEISEDLEVWGELMYTESTFDNAGAPAPWTLSSVTGSASPHAPDLAGDTLTGLRYRSFELGNLTATQEKDALRGLLGFRGELGEWDWETATMYIETNLKVDWSGIADADAITTAIEDGSFNPFAPAYASGETSGTFYDNEKAIREAATKANERFEETYFSEDLKIGGPLFELPAGDVQALLGLEYRKETVDVSVDQAILDGKTLGKLVGALPFSAKRDVVSIFAESLIPLIEANGNSATLPFLDLQLGLRYEGYQDRSGGLKNTYDALVYKGGLTCRPTAAITIHGTYGTAFRAPTLTESFSSEWGSLVYDDTTGSTLPYERVFTQYGANPELDPEESQTLNLGITFEPKPNEGVRVSIEYY
jgi:outer membrane receptor protein involved in Fe transport